MIYDATALPSPLEIEADLCVVGSGAGGAAVAMVAAEAGLKVVVLEAGAFVTPDDMTQREAQMFPQLYWESGARTTDDRAIHIHQGKGVGGSTLHNVNLCKRIPDVILQEWVHDRGLRHLPLTRWHALYAEVEALLKVSDIAPELRTRHNQLLAQGCEALQWRGGWLRHNRTGCAASGFCEVGCAFDAKNNAAKVMIPRAVAAGASVLTRVQAVAVRTEGSRATGVDAVVLGPEGGRGSVTVHARKVCLSASSTATAAILLRSGLPHPAGSVGDTLRIHPAVVAAGDFVAPVQGWKGVPQSYECTEWLDFDSAHGVGVDGNRENVDGSRAAADRIWIIPGFSHPLGTATMLPGYGPPHAAIMARYAHLAPLVAMLHDRTAGKVRPDGDLGVRISYWPDDADRRQLHFGLKACARLLFAAGASRVMVPGSAPVILEAASQIDELDRVRIERGVFDLTAVHPLGTVPMGDDPAVAAVDSQGRHHRVEGLWVGDGSLFPSSVGVPPQLSIYALGLHVGRAIVGNSPD